MFFETSAGIIRENLTFIIMQKNIMRIAIGTGFILLIPLVLTLLARWHWRPGAFVLASVLLFGGAGLTYGLVAKKMMSNKAYRFAVGVALAALFILVWMNAAVGGILGDDPANMMYFGVLLVGFIGAIIARLEPQGMSRALAVAYTTNAKIYPVANIVSGAIDIYYNKPFQIPAFETIAVSPEVLDKYVGVYSSPEVPVKFTITREGRTLFIQPNKESAAPLEATTQDKFQILGGRIVFEFDAAKKQMIHKRGGPARVFTKEK